MSFLSPLLLWFGLGLIPLAAVYLLKVRPRMRRTSTWFLWDAVLEQKRSSALFRRLRDIISLLILALAFVAAVLTMARPVRSVSEDGRPLFILLDTSLSMSAEDGGSSRMELARAAAGKLVKAMPWEQQAVLATLDDDVSYIVHASRNQRRLLRGIKAVETSDYTLNKASLEQLLDGSGLREKSRVVLVTDGSHDIDAEDLGIEQIVVGGRADNVGIVAFDLVRLPARESALGVYFRCHSTYETEQEVELRLSQGHVGNVVRLYRTTVVPGENKGETYQLPDAEPGAWFLECSVGDAMSADDLAYATVPPDEPVTVEVLAQGVNQLFMRACVAAFSDGLVPLALVEDGAEVAMSVGGDIPAGSDKVIAFAPQPESGLCLKIGDLLGPVTVKVPRQRDPLLRFVDVEQLSFAGARELVLPEGAVSLLESESGHPLIYELRSPNLSAYVFNLDPLESDFVFSAYFPMLSYSMCRELSGRTLNHRSSYPPAAVVSSKDSSVSTQFTHLGVYSNAIPELPLSACSLSGSEESSLNPQMARSDDVVQSGGASISYWLIVFALLLCAAESVLYHRRKVG